VYIDGSFVKHKIPVKIPIYITLLNLTTAVSSLAGALHDAHCPVSGKALPWKRQTRGARSAGCICSKVYVVNMWLWQFGRGKPRLGGLTIEETLDRQDSARKASDKHRKETCDGSKDDGA
jgi:hypothetical protein